MSNFKSREWDRVDGQEKEICAKYLTEIPVRIGAMAKELGLSVKASTLRAGISGEIRPSEVAPSGFEIRVNRHESKERQRFTVAHEIAHFLLHRDIINDGISDSVLYRSDRPSRIEAEANRLAADMVMPRETISLWSQTNRATTDSDEFIEQLSSVAKVSKAALKIRYG